MNSCIISLSLSQYHIGSMHAKKKKPLKKQFSRTNHVYWWHWVEIHKQWFEVCQLHLLCFLHVPLVVWAVTECHHFRPLHFSRYLILNLKEINRFLLTIVINILLNNRHIKLDYIENSSNNMCENTSNNFCLFWFNRQWSKNE